ncbi:MAG: hypothetical protein IIB00_02355 [candidate division Zixibacteria bacterium]|nr:hypothetical protein [candidate division Zixibacteria bacterium]
MRYSVSRHTVTFVLFCALVLSTATAATINVPIDQPTIQEGIDSAFNGDTVLVAAGVYTGIGNRDMDFGGKQITVKSESGPDFTIIDCQGDTLSPHRAFLFHTGEDSTTKLEGFTIRGGLVVDGSGAAILCDTASPKISNCRFVRNKCHFELVGNEFTLAAGGAVVCNNSFAIFENCVFDSNFAHAGGALVCDYSSQLTMLGCSFTANQTGPRHVAGFTFSGGGGAIACIGSSSLTLSDCSFSWNAGGAGGALFLHNSTASFQSCVFESNLANGVALVNLLAPGQRGAIYCEITTLTLTECVFTRNVATSPEFQSGPGIGGAAYFTQCSPSLTSCTFFANSASEYMTFTGLGGAICLSNAYPTIEKCIISFSESGNSISRLSSLSVPTLLCCDIYGNDDGDWVEFIADQLDSNDNFSQDPLFCDTSSNDLSIQGNSPCAQSRSLCGQQVGAIEPACGCCAIAGDSDGEGEVNIGDAIHIVKYVFTNGQTPVCLDEGDADGSNDINIGDATYIVKFVFQDGVAPVCGTRGS